MIPFVLALFGAGALFAWYMQRRPLPPLALSFARLLPDPPPSQQREKRFALTLPVSSVAFWLGLIIVALCLAAVLSIWLSLRGLPVRGLALRIVIDTSHSMGIASDGVARIDQARALAEDALGQAARAGALVCAEVTPVASSAGQPVNAMDQLPETAVQAKGAPLSTLITAALAEPSDCPPTHVLVITDHAAPPGLPVATDAGAALFWLQVGDPVPNVGIQAITLAQAGLGGAMGRLIVEISVHGDAEPPRLQIEGFGTLVEVAARASSARSGIWTAEIPYTGTGLYTAALLDPDAYPGDDRLVADLKSEGLGAVDWQLPDLRKPASLADAAGDGVLVARLADAGSADLNRPVVLTYPGWPNPAPGATLIGSFLPDQAFLPFLNLDVLEAALPSPPSMPLPAGFVPVMVVDSGNLPILARRADPPGLIVPHPQPGAASPVRELSTVLFLAALTDLLGGGTVTPLQGWQTAEGPVPMAGLESETARALAELPDLRFDAGPTGGAAEGALFPLLLILTLLVMVAERLHALCTAARRRGDAV